MIKVKPEIDYERNQKESIKRGFFWARNGGWCSANDILNALTVHLMKNNSKKPVEMTSSNDKKDACEVIFDDYSTSLTSLKDAPTAFKPVLNTTLTAEEELIFAELFA